MGIGQSIGDDELLAIAAGNPQYVIHADDFDDLRKSLQQILTESCQGKRNGNVLSRQNLTIKVILKLFSRKRHSRLSQSSIVVSFCGINFFISVNTTFLPVVITYVSS